MGKKSGNGGGRGGAGSAVPGGGLRGGGGGSAADQPSSGAQYGTSAIPVLAAWLKYGKYVVRPLARLIYGSQKKYKVEGVRVGRAAYQRYQRARRANAVTAMQTGTQYVPPTADEWKRRANAAKRPSDPGYRPDLTEKKPPPPKQPPPPPRPPTGPRRPGMGGAGSIRSQIVAYVVANGIVWGINKLGEWIRKRAATAEEIRTGTVQGRTQGGGPRRGRGPDMTGTDTWYESGASQREPLTPIQIFQKRIPVPKYRAPVKPRPIPSPKSPQLEPIIVTASRLPVPVPVKPTPTWLKILKAVPASTNPLSIFKGKKASKSARQLGRALTALETIGVASPLAQTSYYSSFGGGGNTPTSTKRCECKPKRKKKPKEPRTVCYTGSYTERADGLTKLKRRKVPCRSSRKK